MISSVQTDSIYLCNFIICMVKQIGLPNLKTFHKFISFNEKKFAKRQKLRRVHKYNVSSTSFINSWSKTGMRKETIAALDFFRFTISFLILALVPELMNEVLETLGRGPRVVWITFNSQQFRIPLPRSKMATIRKINVPKGWTLPLNSVIASFK